MQFLLAYLSVLGVADERLWLTTEYLPSLKGRVLFVGVDTYNKNHHLLVQNPELFETIDTLPEQAQYGSPYCHHVGDFLEFDPGYLYDHICLFGVMGHAKSKTQNLSEDGDNKKAIRHAHELLKAGGTLQLGPNKIKVKEFDASYWYQRFAEEPLSQYRILLNEEGPRNMIYWGQKPSVTLNMLLDRERKLRDRVDPRLAFMEFPEGNPSRRAKAESFSLLDVNHPTYPELKVEAINTSLEDRERCILFYSSWHAKAEILLAELIHSLKQTGFKGHILHRIGGWPNMEEGCLEHCHVPYGFKACAFLEALHRGYRQALWLDSSVIVLKDLDPLFSWISSHQSLYRHSYYPIEPYVNPLIEKAFQLEKPHWQHFSHIATGVIGLDLTNPTVQKMIGNWHQTVLAEDGYFSFFPDQLPFSYLMHKYGLLDGIYSNHLVKIREEDPSQCFFHIDYQRSSLLLPTNARGL